MKIMTSGLPLPIGTSHALETFLKPVQPVYDKDRKIPTPPRALEDYDVIYINVYTLARNLIGASETFSLSVASKIMVADMQWLKEHIETNVGIRVVYYTTVVTKAFIVPSAVTRTRKLTSVKAKLAQQKVEGLISTVTTMKSLKVVRMSDGIPGNQDSSIVYTSVALDLILHKQHSVMSVLSSHTGSVVDSKDFYKRYFAIPRVNMEIFPFNKVLLRFLGDSLILSPSPLGKRRELYDIALGNNWTHKTSMAKIKQNLRDVRLALYSEIFKTN